MLAPVEEMVGRLLAVPAGDDRRPRAEPHERLGQLGRRRVRPRQCPRLEQVRRHHGREREEPADEHLHRVVLEQPRAGARHHHRIDDERQRMLLEPVGHGLDDLAGEEHPGLRSVDPDVAGDRVELRAHEPRRHLVDGGDLARVLRRERDDRRHAVNAGGGERLQVGLDPGPSAGIGARNRDAAWNQRTPFAGMTRIRFDGCDLSLVEAPR